MRYLLEHTLMLSSFALSKNTFLWICYLMFSYAPFKTVIWNIKGKKKRNAEGQWSVFVLKDREQCNKKVLSEMFLWVGKLGGGWGWVGDGIRIWNVKWVMLLLNPHHKATVPGAMTSWVHISIPSSIPSFHHLSVLLTFFILSFVRLSIIILYLC